MKTTTTLLAAFAAIAFSASAYAQVTPGGSGERKAGEAPPTTASKAPMAAPKAKARAKTSGSAAKGENNMTTGNGSNKKGTALPSADQ
jgi:hypothetical protein